MSSKEKDRRKIIGLIVLLIAFIIVGISVIVGMIVYSVQTKLNNNTSDVAEENVVEEATSDEEEEEYEYPAFDEESLIVSSNDIDADIEYQLKEYDALGIFSAVISEDSAYLTIEDLTDKYDALYSSIYVEKNKSYQIQNVSENVIDLHIGYVGSNYNSPILVILTESGNVQCVNIVDGLSSGIFEANDVICKNVVRIENMLVKTDTSVEMSIMLVKTNGDSFNIKDLI